MLSIPVGRLTIIASDRCVAVRPVARALVRDNYFRFCSVLCDIFERGAVNPFTTAD